MDERQLSTGSQAHASMPEITEHRPPTTISHREYHQTAPQHAGLTTPVAKQSNGSRPDEHLLELQSELLQFCVWHQKSFMTRLQWEGSAKKHFETPFERLSSTQSKLRISASKHQRLRNHLDLAGCVQSNSTSLKFGTDSSDGQDPAPAGITALSRNIADIEILTAPYGKFANVIGAFEKWMDWVCKIRKRRTKHSNFSNGNTQLIESIGDGWKRQASMLESRFRSLIYSFQFSKELKHENRTTLGKVLQLWHRRANNSVTELETIQSLEKDIVTQEEVWVQRRLAFLTSAVDSGISMGR